MKILSQGIVSNSLQNFTNQHYSHFFRTQAWLNKHLSMAWHSQFFHICITRKLGLWYVAKFGRPIMIISSYWDLCCPCFVDMYNRVPPLCWQALSQETNRCFCNKWGACLTHIWVAQHASSVINASNHVNVEWYKRWSPIFRGKMGHGIGLNCMYIVDDNGTLVWCMICREQQQSP